MGNNEKLAHKQAAKKNSPPWIGLVYSTEPRKYLNTFPHKNLGVPYRNIYFNLCHRHLFYHQVEIVND